MPNGTKPVRVVAVTQSDPFFTARFFEAFLEGRSSDRLDLVEIVLLRNFNESKPALVRRLFQLYGPVDFMRLLEIGRASCRKECRLWWSPCHLRKFAGIAG